MKRGNEVGEGTGPQGERGGRNELVLFGELFYLQLEFFAYVLALLLTVRLGAQAHIPIVSKYPHLSVKKTSIASKKPPIASKKQFSKTTVSKEAEL